MGSVGLEGLQGLVLETILLKLEAKQAAAAACVSTRLRAAASDDDLWQCFCHRDFDISTATDPNRHSCPTFKVAYVTWYRSVGMYPLPLVKRAKQCWGVIKNWMAVNFPEAGDTLREGTNEQLIEDAEESLRLKFPIAMKVLYRFVDGQETMAQDISSFNRLSPLGIIGGYDFYDHVVNVHLLPLRQIVTLTRALTVQLGFTTRSNYIVVAVSHFSAKWFFLDCSNSQLYVGTKNLSMDGEMMPCVPQALIRPRSDAEHSVPQDALLLWLEEHGRRLQSGMIKTRVSRGSRAISLYPESPPSCSVAVTNGVQVRASAILVPELSDLSRGEDKYLFSYSIRMSLGTEGCRLDGTYFSSCQLCSRHWIIRSKDAVVADVHGDGVIGEYPVLLPKTEEYIYESCTPIPETPGSIEGSFTFLPGRLTKREGRDFDVKVPQFKLDEPEYIF